jgi:hypothetical protein
MLHTKFQFIWESSFRGEDFFRNQPIRNKKWHVAAMFVNGSGQNYSSFILFKNAVISIQILNKSSPLKPLDQMNRNLVGSIYGRSSVNIAHFVPIPSQTWLS